jgi:hypothetical protein
MKRHLVTLVCLMSAVLPGQSLAQLQGKLFTTPEQRAYLDALRQDFLANNRESGFDIEESAIPPLPGENAVEPTQREEYTLEGIMTRRDGSHVIWLNNRSFTEEELPDGIALVADDDELALRLRTGTGSQLLLPGQTIDIISGEVRERYQRIVPGAADSDETAQP